MLSYNPFIAACDFAPRHPFVPSGELRYTKIGKYSPVNTVPERQSSELMVMTVCVAAGAPLPLLPTHGLWINLVTDGPPAPCLATDKSDAKLMKRPRVGTAFNRGSQITFAGGNSGCPRYRDRIERACLRVFYH